MSSARYVIDASHSHASFSVRHLMIFNVRGDFQKFSGEVEYDPENPEKTKVQVSLEVASINTRDEKRDGHLRSADFFDAESHPAMDFKSTGARLQGGSLEVVGGLTIRGVTREVVLTVEGITQEGKDPWGNTRIGGSAHTNIKRSDFGITWNATLDAGGVVVSDEVKIQLEVQLIKQA